MHSHRFPGANTALPFVNGDKDQLELTQAFLKAGAVTIDVFGLVPGGEGAVEEKRAVAGGEPRLSSSFAQGEESMSFGTQQAVVREAEAVIAPLDKVDAAVRRGDSARLEVVVRTRKVGHFFPGGTVDAFDVWVELEVTDSNGRKIFHSGFTEPDPNGKDRRGPVEPGAHFYRSLQLDEHGNPINKRNAWATRSRRLRAADPARRRGHGALPPAHPRGLRRPPRDQGEAQLPQVRLVEHAVGVRRRARSRGQGLLDHPEPRRRALGCSPATRSKVSGKLKAIPDIPTTTMAEASASVRVLPKGAALPKTAPLLDASVRERWNDYGIGLLLQGDLKGAEAAFLGVTRMEPGYADGWVNVGRARLTEGNLAGAEEALRKALQVDPGLAKTHFFLGTALKQSGRYDEALPHLRQAAALYPRDRVVMNQLGRLLFLERRYREAIAELKQVLAIDPEDLQAHYNLMLCYQGVGDGEMAKRHEALYRRFKADESAQTITGPYRQLHPDDNNERQSVHEHASGLAPAALQAKGSGPAAGKEATATEGTAYRAGLGGAR